MQSIKLEERLMTALTLAPQKSSIKPRLKGFKTLFTHQTFRCLVQLAFAGFIAYVTIIHVLAREGAANITVSPEAYCPFGGLEMLYKYVTAGGSFVSHTHLSNLVVAIVVLVTALLLRSAFCGWICPLGFIQDLMHNFSAWLQKRFVPLRKAFRLLGQRGRIIGC
jgi:polyferredoxin